MVAKVDLGSLNQPYVTLLAALIGVFGALSGLVVERLLRALGRMWCEPAGWKLKFMVRNHTERGGYSDVEVEPTEAPEGAWVTYSASLDLYNGKEIPVGLRDISVVFIHDGSKLIHKPWDATSGVFSYGHTTYATLVTVNLSPCQWVRLELLGTVREVEAMKGWRRAEFVGQRRGAFGRRRTFQKTIATRDREG